MNPISLAKKQTITFLILTFALSAIFYYLILSEGSTAAGGLYVLGLMWMPGLSAILTSLIHRQTLRQLGWRPGKVKYLALAYVLPLLYALPVYAIAWITGLGGFSTANLPNDSNLVRYLLVAPTLMFLLASLPSALGEEIGWRGLLVPQLARLTSFTRLSLLTGIIWAAWHTPLILFGDYRADTPVWFSWICFTIMVVGISFAFSWLRLKSGSLWPAAVLHATHNLFIQAVFDLLSVDKGSTAYLTTEFGVGLALTGIVVGLVFWRLAQKDPALSAAPQAGQIVPQPAGD